MPIVSGPGTITMPNSLGSWTKKLDKNGDVAGFYTNLADGPCRGGGEPAVSQQDPSEAATEPGFRGPENRVRFFTFAVVWSL